MAPIILKVMIEHRKCERYYDILLVSHLFALGSDRSMIASPYESQRRVLCTYTSRINLKMLGKDAGAQLLCS